MLAISQTKLEGLESVPLSFFSLSLSLLFFFYFLLSFSSSSPSFPKKGIKIWPG